MPPTSTATQGNMEAIMAEFARQQQQMASNTGSSMFNSLAAGAAAAHQQQQTINSFSVVVGLLSVHLANLKIEHDIRASFSPANSRATYENRVYKEFFNLTISPQRSFILFSAKDAGSMLRLDQLGDVQRLDQEFMSVLRKQDSSSGTNGCDPLCNLNVPFQLISGEATTDEKNGLLLDYPTSIYHGNKLFVGMNMIGAQLTKNGEVFASNNSRIVSVKTIILWYFSRADTTELKSRLRKATLELFESAKQGKRLKYVDFQIFGDEIANSEMVRGAIEAQFLCLLALCCCLCSLHSPFITR
uniref:Uncharacterized protein n=1 Tax=Ditylenchus dipsaci TaxID=166011 RepID=A0A915D398_9BILA